MGCRNQTQHPPLCPDSACMMGHHCVLPSHSLCLVHECAFTKTSLKTYQDKEDKFSKKDEFYSAIHLSSQGIVLEKSVINKAENNGDFRSKALLFFSYICFITAQEMRGRMMEEEIQKCTSKYIGKETGFQCVYNL